MDPAADPASPTPSLQEATANLGARALGTVGTRLELAGVELAEARLRLVQSLLLVGAALACAMLALMVVTVGVIAWFWETDRYAAIITLAVLYAAAAAILVYRFSTLGRRGPGLFAASIAALRADAATLRSRHAPGDPP